MKDNKNRKNISDDEFQIKVKNDIQTINDYNNFKLCQKEKNNDIINLETASSNNKIGNNNIKIQNNYNYSSNEKFKNKKEDEKKNHISNQSFFFK